MANEKTPVVWDDTTKKHRPLGTGEKMGGLDASSLLSSDSGNLLEAGSDGLAYLSGSGIVDPRADNLLEESDRGKLQVTVDRIAEWLDGHPQDAAALVSSLADGETIVVSGGKLVVDPSTAPKAKLQSISAALRKAGAGLSVDSGTGKLVVDFASMDPAIMRAVVLSMVQQGGGIAVDPDGKLYVDFDSMPTDKFEAMLKSLKMLVPLSAHMHLYVDDDSDGDSLVDGRGTQAKPFKTVQACVNYVTGTYAFGRFSVYIHVLPGTYSAPVLTLPDYSHTTGIAFIQAEDMEHRPVFTNSGNLQSVVSVTGGEWRIQGIVIRNIVTDNGSSVPEYPNGLVVSKGASVLLYYTQVYVSYADAAPSHGIYVRAITLSDGSTLSVMPHVSGASGVEVHKGNASSATAISIASDSYFAFSSSNIANEGDIYKFFMSGEVTVAVSVGGGSFGWSGGAANKIEMAIPSGGSLTGTRAYSIISGGSMYMKSSSPVPGTYSSEPSVESASYSWYAVNPNI